MRKLTQLERERCVQALIIGVLMFFTLIVADALQTQDEDQSLPCRGSFGQRLPDEACE